MDGKLDTEPSLMENDLWEVLLSDDDSVRHDTVEPMTPSSEEGEGERETHEEIEGPGEDSVVTITGVRPESLENSRLAPAPQLVPPLPPRLPTPQEMRRTLRPTPRSRILLLLTALLTASIVFRDPLCLCVCSIRDNVFHCPANTVSSAKALPDVEFAEVLTMARRYAEQQWHNVAERRHYEDMARQAVAAAENAARIAEMASNNAAQCAAQMAQSGSVNAREWSHAAAAWVQTVIPEMEAATKVWQQRAAQAAAQAASQAAWLRAASVRHMETWQCQSRQAARAYTAMARDLAQDLAQDVAPRLAQLKHMPEAAARLERSVHRRLAQSFSPVLALLKEWDASATAARLQLSVYRGLTPAAVAAHRLRTALFL